MTALAVLAGLALVVIIVFYYLKSVLWPEEVREEIGGSVVGTVKTQIPGMPKSDPERGNLDDIDTAGGLHEFLSLLHSKYGPVASFWYGKHYYVSLASPEAWKDTIKIFDRPPELFQFVLPLIGPGSIQYANGEEGKRRRNTFDKSFSHEAIQNYYSDFQSAADSTAEKISSLPTEEHIPLAEYMSIMTIKAISRATFGGFFKKDEQAVALLHHYETVMGLLYQRIANEAEAGEKFNTALKAWHDFMHGAVQHRRDNPPKAGDAHIFMDVLIDYFDNEEDLFSDALSYFMASFHTTAFMMVWSIYYICKHQDVQDKVYKEVNEVLGKDGKVNHTNLAELQYMKMVFDESMRCSVLAPFAARVNYEKDMKVQGYLVPKGTGMIHALGVVLQDAKIWPEPESFDPDRFQPEKVAKRHNLAHSPFGFAGKRICPGYRIAYAEGAVFLATLLKKFKFHLVEGQDISRKFGFVTIPSDEVWVKVSKRE